MKIILLALIAFAILLFTGYKVIEYYEDELFKNEIEISQKERHMQILQDQVELLNDILKR